MPNHRQLVDNLEAMWPEVSRASRHERGTQCQKFSRCHLPPLVYPNEREILGRKRDKFRFWEVMNIRNRVVEDRLSVLCRLRIGHLFALPLITGYCWINRGQQNATPMHGDSQDFPTSTKYR